MTGYCPDHGWGDESCAHLHRDRFTAPQRFPSGVRWEPTDPKPLPPETQDAYRAFAATRGPGGT